MLLSARNLDFLAARMDTSLILFSPANSFSIVNILPHKSLLCHETIDILILFALMTQKKHTISACFSSNVLGW